MSVHCGRVGWTLFLALLAAACGSRASAPASCAPNGLTSGTYEHTFAQAGTFAYPCDFHPQMKATVTVR